MTASANWLVALRIYLSAAAGMNLVWEALHLPLYTLWKAGTVHDQIVAVVHCTFGDILIATTSLSLALIFAGRREWPGRTFVPVALLNALLGVGYTVYSEWLNVAVRNNWAYAELMPIISLFHLRIGASPLLQWIVVPLVALSLARRASAVGDQKAAATP